MIALKSEVENNFEMGHPACVLTRGKQNNCQFIAKITESFCGGGYLSHRWIPRLSEVAQKEWN